jgi:hypothetical protein
MGIGIILTAIVMGFALGGRKRAISDAEVIERAKALGMVEASGVLSQYAEDGGQNNENNQTAPDTSLDQKGEEVSEEVNQGEPQTGESVPEVDEAAKENEQVGENSESIESEEDVKLASNAAVENASTDVIETEGKQEDAATEKSEAKVEETEKKEEKTTIENSTSNETVPDASAAANAASSTADTTESKPAEAEAAKPATTEGSSDVNYVVVVLPSGSESDTCARILRESGVIDDGVAFNKYLVSSGQDRKIRSGTKQIPRGASFEEIASIITK